MLPRTDGIALLKHYRPAQTKEDTEALEAVAAEVGQLPLALHLAGGYLGRYRNVVTPAAYLEQLRRSPLIDHRSLTAAGISPTDHIQSIAATFALSVDKLATDEPDEKLARQCLVRASYLAPGESIPRTILHALGRPTDSPDSDFDLEDALQRLAELGLVDDKPRGPPACTALWPHSYSTA